MSRPGDGIASASSFDSAEGVTAGGRLARLRAEHGLTYLLVSHNLAVVAHMCDRLAVMKEGEIVERLDVEQLMKGETADPYTAALLLASRGYDRSQAEGLAVDG